MKRILTLIIIGFAFPLIQPTFGQLNVWRWQNPAVQGTTMNAVQMLSLTTTVACGYKGSVMKTTDGGITWDMKNLMFADSSSFYALNFLDANYGMVCGENGLIYKTTDGGASWNKLVTSTTLSLRGIVIIDMNTAIAVGDAGSILKTTDGGASWVQSTFEASNNYTSIRMLRPDFITITGKIGVLYKTIDQGSNWQKITLSSNMTTISNDIFGQVFYNDKTAILVGDLGGIFSTTDGGISWTNRSVENVSSARLRSIDGKDPSGSIYATIGENGAVFQTSNSGANWIHIALGITDTLDGISFFDKLDAMAVGYNGLILKTTDGGVTWTFIPIKPETDPLYGIAFPKGDTSLGIAVGSYGAIMRTTNGGAHWDVIPGVTSLNISSVTFLSSTEVCAAGQYGLILRSHDAGVHWEQKSSGTSKSLRSLSFPTPNFGWAVGDSGIVISTIDGGSTWTLHPYSDKRFFTGISFSDSLHGYMGCDHGVYITTDGGVNWADPDDITYYTHCTSIHSPSPNVVSYTYWPCSLGGSGGIYANLPPAGIMTSHDGGKNWFNKQYDEQTIFTGVFFSDDLHGTAVGHFSQSRAAFITHTTDGGMIWTQQQFNGGGLNAVAFGTNKAGNAVGVGGLIIRRTTDE